MPKNPDYDAAAFRQFEHNGWAEVSGTYHDSFGTCPWGKIIRTPSASISSTAASPAWGKYMSTRQVPKKYTASGLEGYSRLAGGCIGFPVKKYRAAFRAAARAWFPSPKIRMEPAAGLHFRQSTPSTYTINAARTKPQGNRILKPKFEKPFKNEE